MQPLTPADRRENRLAELQRKLEASERMGLKTRVVAIQAEIERLNAEV